MQTEQELFCITKKNNANIRAAILKNGYGSSPKLLALRYCILIQKRPKSHAAP